MVEFTSHKYWIFTRKEIWFYNGEHFKPGTYTVFSAAQKTPDFPSRFLEKYFTSVIDLKKTEEDLLAAIHPTFRYDIRNAQKQKVEVRQYLTPAQQDWPDLIKQYSLFAKEKNIDELSPAWIETTQKAGCICYTKAFLNNVDICTHVYILDKTTASLFSSFHNTLYTNNKIRSEANKLLHWQDIIFFQEKGYAQYDLGGLNPQKLPGVSKFKTNFGGKTTENFRFIAASSVVFTAARFFKKLKNYGSKR